MFQITLTDGRCYPASTLAPESSPEVSELAADSKTAQLAARMSLDLAPPTPEGLYWLAYLRHDFHDAHLMMATEYIKEKAFDQAMRSIETARQWPEKLGAGKPYSEDVDERLEDWLVAGRQIPSLIPR